MRRMRMRLAAAAPLAALALLAAGCGGSSSKGSASGSAAGATVVPASAVAYVSVNTDLGSDQWKKADALSKKFPGRAKAIADFEQSLAKKNLDFQKDVKPALGPEIDVAWLDFADGGQNAVAVTQPKDDAKFAALVKKNNADSSNQKLYTEKVGDWTAISDSQAKLDRLKSAQNGAKLADDSSFKDAVADLPDESLVNVYVNGGAIRQAVRQGIAPSVGQSGLLGKVIPNLGWLSASASAASNGVGFQAGVKSSGTKTKSYKSALVDRLPAGALADLSFNNLSSNLRRVLNQAGLRAQAAQVEQALGISENDLLKLLSNEGALAVYPSARGERYPSVELLLKVNDEAKARKLLNRLSALAPMAGAKVKPVTIGGVAAHELVVSGQISVDYGVFDGVLAVSNSRSALAGLGAGGVKLGSDPVFTDARSAAKAPSSTAGFAYVNVRGAVMEYFKLLGFSTAAPDTAELRANLAPLRSFFAYGARKGDVGHLNGFLVIK
jgi:Protein of unknown function (DUF3352)